MIKFSLKCDRAHRFESWFQSTAAFDKLTAAGMVSCAVCGSPQVQKALMAPNVQAGRDKAALPAKPETPQPQAAPDAPAPDPGKLLAAYKKHVEANSDYVGLNFAAHARDMHEGLAPHRPIYGEAKPDEARKLIEDGVPVAPLPFIPSRKSN
ncbi:MAG: DUF1178 family protein [Rhodobacteraceae bacterium]|nr:DUF1178 family protein [Paracoccaceae bacterium]